MICPWCEADYYSEDANDYVHLGKHFKWCGVVKVYLENQKRSEVKNSE